MNTPIIKEAIAWFESLPPDPKLSPEATSLALAVALHIVRQQTKEESDWIKHGGNACPVPRRTPVRVRFSDNTQAVGFASNWGISWLDTSMGITHYKILE